MLPAPPQLVQFGKLDVEVKGKSSPVVADFCLPDELWPNTDCVFLPGNSRWGRMGGNEIRGQARPGRLKGRCLGSCGKRKGA